MPISHLQLSEIYNPPAPFTVVPCTSLTKKSATATELRVFKGRFRRPPNFSCFSVLDNKSSQRDCDSSAQSSSFPQLISKGSGLLRNKIDLVAPDTKGVAFKPPLSLCRSPYGNGLRRGTVGKDVEDKGPEQESRDFKGKAELRNWKPQETFWNTIQDLPTILPPLIGFHALCPGEERRSNGKANGKSGGSHHQPRRSRQRKGLAKVSQSCMDETENPFS